MKSLTTGWGRQVAAAMVMGLTLVAWAAAPSQALPPDDDDLGDDPPGFDCLTGATATLTATPPTINLGQSATVRWNVQLPAGCVRLPLWLNASPVDTLTSFTVHPIANANYTLRAKIPGASRVLGTVAVTVVLPPTVTIGASNQASLLVQALGTANTVVNVANHVQLDLSGREGIAIAGGVRLLGGRTPREPGGRLYTTTFPHYLFKVVGDDVHIAGLRIDGGEMGVADEGDGLAVGIGIQSRVGVDITNNEIYGWRGSAVEVLDDEDRISLAVNPTSVRIRQNYIHHNEHQRREGYGVEVSHGAYALIEKNVFDWNRHAIAGDGSDGSGYFAYRNLVLAHGGHNFWALYGWWHTHMFDMHGQNDCGGYDGYCGPAGEYMDIRYNTFLYDDDSAFKLRGTPAIRADVAHNVFKHRALFHTMGPVNTFVLGALDQTESGLTQWDNLTGVDESDESDELGPCDFDADGVLDTFFATGQTWWFNSGGNRHWVYLNTSTRRAAELTLADVDGDGSCDVAADGIVWSGGTAAIRR